jgi:hypothetical protein
MQELLNNRHIRTQEEAEKLWKRVATTGLEKPS